LVDELHGALPVNPLPDSPDISAQRKDFKEVIRGRKKSHGTETQMSY
jgi:hypothetical protein